MIKDRGQKEMLYKHFRARGWMVQVEVPVSTVAGVSSTVMPITDIDVFGIQPSDNLEWRFVIGDCKTKRRESPANRVLWVRGLQDAVGASSAVVLLRRDAGSRIELDHKLFAERMRTLLIEEKEFAAYDRAVIYPRGSADYWNELEGVDAIREKLGRDFPALAPFSRWLLSEAWGELDHSKLLRQILGRAREVRGEIDPRRDDHLALVLELVAAFAIPFATLVGTVFRRHIQPDARNDLDDAVRVIIWGGREQYEFFDSMRREIANARGRTLSDPLALPHWDGFLEILRSYLEAPHLAFRTPQLMRRLAAGTILGCAEESLSAVKDKMLLLLAQRLTSYVIRAIELPADAYTRTANLIKQRIAEVSRQASGSSAAKNEEDRTAVVGVEEPHFASQRTLSARPDDQRPTQGDKEDPSSEPSEEAGGDLGSPLPGRASPQLSFDASGDVIVQPKVE